MRSIPRLSQSALEPWLAAEPRQPVDIEVELRAPALEARRAGAERAEGGARRRDAPVRLLLEVEPQHRADPRARGDVVEHLGDPRGLVAALLRGADLADLHRLARRQAPQRLELVVEDRRGRPPAAPRERLAAVEARERDDVDVVVARVLAVADGPRHRAPHPADVGGAFGGEDVVHVAPRG